MNGADGTGLFSVSASSSVAFVLMSDNDGFGLLNWRGNNSTVSLMRSDAVFLYVNFLAAIVVGCWFDVPSDGTMWCP